jgi:hypothetical protein
MLKVINNQKPKVSHRPILGQFYSRYDNPEVLYIVVSMTARFGLVNVNTGQSYSSGVDNIDNIFSEFGDLFYLITEPIEIKIG